MSVRINTNIEALNAHRNLGVSASQFAKSVEKLSSGLRINRAADDAAGLAISEKLRAQVRGLSQAGRNAQDGICMVQTAEGALGEVHSMLQRLRELAVQASNSTVSTDDLVSVNTEIVALQEEINRIGKATSFNGSFLLTGALSTTQTGGTLAVGTSLTTGASATVSAIDVTGASSGKTYTITAQAWGNVTLSDGAGNSQQVAITAGTARVDVNFATMGVRLSMVGSAAKSAADYATDLAAVGGVAGPPTVGGNAGANLVAGEVLQTRTYLKPLFGVNYNGTTGFSDTGGTTPMTAAVSLGVGAGTLVISWANIDAANGDISVAYDGGTFTGTLDTPTADKLSTVTLTDGALRTITLSYKQGSAPSIAGQRTGMVWADFEITTAGTTGTMSAITAGPTAVAGTYTLTAPGNGALVLTGPGAISEMIGVGEVNPGGTQTLDFSSLGISFDVGAVGGILTRNDIIGNLLRPGNNTIVVVAGGTGGASTITTGGSGAANFQVGANSTADDRMSVTFADARTATFTGFDAAVSTFTGAKTNANARAIISTIDTAIAAVSTIRGGLGAAQNRLEHTIASLGVASENLTASESRIRDLDVASEMVNFTKTQILQQAGAAILAQANQAPQGILVLLR